MPSPYFSIVMPVKNRESMVGETIESILAQTLKDWELIVINDHSTDGTRKVVQTFKDPRIRVYDLPEGKTGISTGRDFGNEKAKGKIIVVADSDDTSYPNRLKVTHDYFETHPETDVWYGNIDKEYVENGKIETRWFQPFNGELLKQINYIPNTASAYRKTAYESVEGYDPNLVVAEDYDLWLQFLETGKTFGFLEKPVTKYRDHQGNITKEQSAIKEKQKFQMKRKHGLPEQIDRDKVHKLARPEVCEAFKDKP